jgi:hypothetical protein
VVLDTVTSHEAGDGFFGYGESAAESAALIGPRQLDDFDTTQLGEKLAHLIKRGDHLFGRARQAEFTQAMAAHLDSDFEGELTIDFHYLGDVSEVFTKLERIVAKMFETRLAVKPVIVVISHHRDATAGRANDVVVLAEDLEEPFGQGTRSSVAAGVSHGLAAASLLLGELDIEAQAAQNAQCRDSNLGIKLVDVTWYEKTDVWHVQAQVPSWGVTSPRDASRRVRFRYRRTRSDRLRGPDAGPP